MPARTPAPRAARPLAAVAVAVVATAAALALVAQPARAEAPRSFTLDNGAEVRLFPSAGLGWVGVVAAYEVGFLHEPEGRAQMSHLVEHLRITAPAAGAAANEVWAQLGALGSANGETQTGFTYYDTLVPADRLELALRVEAERLTALAPTQADLEREGPRAAREATNMLGSPDPFLHKFALMAAVQGWAHGAAVAALVGGLDRVPIDEAERFRVEHYTPGALTLLVTGDFDPAAARELIGRTIGAVEPAPAPLAPAIDWGAQPAERRLAWDLPRSAVIVAHEPPADRLDRAAVSAAMALLPAVLHADPLESVGPVLGTGLLWPAGETPTMALGVVREGFTAEDAAEEIASRLDALAEGGLPPHLLAPLRAGRTLPAALAPPELEMQGRQLAAMRGIDVGRATAMAALQTSLNLHALERAVGGDPEGLRQHLRELDAGAWRALLGRALAPERRFVTILEPAPRPAPAAD